jgi:repressor LexA
MATFADRLKEALEIRNISAAELSRKLGINEGTMSQYKAGKYEPKQRRLQEISQILSVSIPWLMGADVPMEDNQSSINLLGIKNIIPMPKMKKVPLIGTIACGEPILAQENIEDYINMPAKLDGTFALRCKGDSMINARILDGDIAFIREQPEVENGEIAAVLIDNEATLKRVYYYPEKSMLILKPENTAYQDFIYINEELNNIKILGKAIAFLSSVK